MKYTILLLRPDYVASNFGQDTFQAWVEADTVEAAETYAQRAAYESDRDDDDIVGNPADYYVLAVYEGHLSDLRAGS